MKATTQEMLDAIRNHKLVGRGSCTVVDECYSDRYIARELETYKVETIDGAIAYAINEQSGFLEAGLNQRFGDEGDPQLVEWKEWQERIAGLETTEPTPEPQPSEAWNNVVEQFSRGYAIEVCTSTRDMERVYRLGWFSVQNAKALGQPIGLTASPDDATVYASQDEAQKALEVLQWNAPDLEYSASPVF